MSTDALPRTRWIQLLLGLTCMVVISSPQYVWALFTQPLTAGLGSTLPRLQITFSILIVVQTFLSPWQGVLVDRFGPRLLLSIGVLITGLSWILAAHASSLTMLYLTYGLLGGIGTGIVYVGVIGHMVQWFPDKRGLATGLVAAGYGIGALLTTFPIAAVLRESTYQSALTRFGLVFGIVGLVAAQGLRRPDAAWRTAADQRARSRGGQTAGAVRPIDVSPAEMIGTRIFWLMFAMMTMMSTTGLMVTSQMGAFTRDFGMASVLVFGLPVLPLALSLDRITNGATRPLFGWISDRFGRENTMLIAFALEGTAMTLWLLARAHPVLFVLLSGVVFFGWGEIFSLFPSTLTDTFGTKHATANYGCLYMAQGVGSVLGGPMAALLHQSTGSWLPVFAVIITMDFTTAALAIAALKPMRRRWLENTDIHRGTQRAEEINMNCIATDRRASLKRTATLFVIVIGLVAASGSGTAGQGNSGGAAAVLTPPRAEAKKYVPTVYYDTFTAAHPAALKIKSGDRVATTTVDDTGAGADGQTVAKGPNPQTGPFYIEGAEPGDMIVVSIEKLEPNRLSGLSPSVMVANSFDTGSLANHDAPRVPWTIDKDKGVVRLDLTAVIPNVDWHQRFISPRIELPLRPMLGSLGVAAASKDESGASGPFGGNLMYPGLTAGVRVMLPVYQPGALLYLGRGYARQGDGNPTGAGIEMSMNVEFSVELMKKREWGHSSIVRPSTAFQDDDLGVSGIEWPRIETNDWVMCVGSGPSFMVALQHATSELDHWLDDDFGFSERSVAILLGPAIEYEIANVADQKNFTVVAKMKKSYLPAAAMVQQ